MYKINLVEAGCLGAAIMLCMLVILTSVNSHLTSREPIKEGWWEIRCEDGVCRQYR